MKVTALLVLARLCLTDVDSMSLAARLARAVGQAHDLTQVLPELVIAIFNVGSQENLATARSKHEVQDPVPQSQPFPCNTEGFRSPTPPTSVHKLRPGDIDVIGAIGDSFTAGVGAVTRTFLENLGGERRGLSASGGGEGTWREYLTLPNILKEFNPNLVGYSRGHSYWNHRNSQFNVAFNAAFDEDLPVMVRTLVQRIKMDKRVDFKQHWKLVTILIGGNNLCTGMCYGGKDPSAAVENHRRNLQYALDYLQEHLPRTFVSLIGVQNVGKLLELKERPLMCHVTKYTHCSCFSSENGIRNRDKYLKVIQDFYSVEENLVNNSRYSKKEDFTVVIQPFTKDFHVPHVNTSRGPKVDYSYLAQDCFHLSQKGYATVANIYWNNLLEPVANKTKEWEELFKRFLCPTPRAPYLFTSKNSETFLKTGHQ